MQINKIGLATLRMGFYTLLTFGVSICALSAQEKANNPVIFADVPDLSMIRIGDTYYMSSTTMHMSPGVPIMRSKDLVNWELVSYAYETLSDIDAISLENGKSTYGRGSWASCIRYNNNTFYVTTFAQTTGKTHVYTTSNIEEGNWAEKSFEPAYHDSSIFFDDDGKVYMIYGNGKLFLKELKPDLSGLKENGIDQVLIENASAPAGDNIMLGAEGSQVFKVNGKYYLFNIVWPRDGMRTVLIYRAEKITGPWEGRVALQDKGVAQGGLIDTPDGRWFAYLFRDFGGVGRIPYLVPVKWENGWPILGEDGKVPIKLDLPKNKSLIPGIVDSDEFKRKKKDDELPLVWQWNHNPDNSLWSVRERKGHLRLKTGRIDSSFVLAKNTLTQRTIGPESTASISLDVSDMKDGDFAGLCLLQKNFGLIGVKMENGKKHVVMKNSSSGEMYESIQIPLKKKKIFFQARCNFKDKIDKGSFYYSLNGRKWHSIGKKIDMPYTLPHFMGYRYGIFNYATKTTGGYVDVNYFRIKDEMSN